MATQKRRVIYVTTEEWEATARAAEARGLTISAYIRERLREKAEERLAPREKPL